MSFYDDVKAAVGAIAEIPQDLVAAGQALFGGFGGFVGVAVGAAGLYLWGPGALIPVVIAAAGASQAANASIRYRPLSQEEWVQCTLVFGDTLPARNSILLTNLAGLSGRCFVIPNVAGQILMNFGKYFDHPLEGNSKRAERGTLLIHEATHVWQVGKSTWSGAYLCEAISVQMEEELVGGAYTLESGVDWDDLNLEQQAIAAQYWYGGPYDGENCCKSTSRYYPYVLRLTGGACPPAASTVYVKRLAQLRYGLGGSFSVRSTIPLSKSGSLRNSLVGRLRHG